MTNGVVQEIATSGPMQDTAIARRLSIRARQNREPAASQYEAERGSTVVSSKRVRQMLAKTWGWA
jgi:hypothetical protein